MHIHGIFWYFLVCKGFELSITLGWRKDPNDEHPDIIRDFMLSWLLEMMLNEGSVWDFTSYWRSISSLPLKQLVNIALIVLKGGRGPGQGWHFLEQHLQEEEKEHCIWLIFLLWLCICVCFEIHFFFIESTVMERLDKTTWWALATSRTLVI